MPLCYYFRSFVLEMVSSQRNRTTWKEKVKWATIKGEEEEKDYEGKVYKNKRPLNPTHIYLKKEK